MANSFMQIFLVNYGLNTFSKEDFIGSTPENLILICPL